MRNTDRDWATWALVDPYYAVLTRDEFRRENLTAEAMETFFQTGRDEIDHIVRLIRQNVDPAFAPRSAIDFGCGVGRLSLAMAEHSAAVFGIDVAPAMLAEATRDKASRAPKKAISFAHDLPSQKVDWISSHLVIQHIPPARGMVILKSLLAGLNAGGIISLEFPAYREVKHTTDIFDEVKSLRFDGSRIQFVEAKDGPDFSMAMYDYDMTSVLAAYAAAGLKSMWVQHTDYDGHHAFMVIGRKAA